MKIMIIGLGNFGSALAIELTQMGHEVMGVDKSLHKAELLKEKITRVLAMNVAEKAAIDELPIDDMDLVVVAIGENFGDSVLTTALLKEAGVKRLICRGINETHNTILQSIGVDEILMPEANSAYRYAHFLITPQVKNAYYTGDDYEIVEVEAPKRYETLSIKEMAIDVHFNLTLLLIKRGRTAKNKVGRAQIIYTELLPNDPEIRVTRNDVLVVFGNKKDIRKFVAY